jgi:hypothetical protein
MTLCLVSTSAIEKPIQNEESSLLGTITGLKTYFMEKLDLLKRIVSKTIAALTELKVKDRKDICVWKICSRPLKVVQPKTNENSKIVAPRYNIIKKDSKIVCSRTPEGFYHCDIVA